MEQNAHLKKKITILRVSRQLESTASAKDDNI